MNYRWTVQAHAAGRGWETICHTENRTEAEQEAQRLRLDHSAWRQGVQHRRVRIVPYTEAEVVESVA